MFKKTIICSQFIGEGMFNDFCCPWGFDTTIDWNDPSQYDFESETIYLSAETEDELFEKSCWVAKLMEDTLKFNCFPDQDEKIQELRRR